MASQAYKYDVPRAYCEALGIPFDEGALPVADTVLWQVGLTQKQVDAVVCLYAWNMAYYWKPSTYTRWQRVKIAWLFLRTLRLARGSI